MPIENTYDRILAYLKGLLSDRQRHDLEKEMMHDVFDEEAFEGLSLLSPGELKADMDKIGNRLQKRVEQDKKRILPVFLRLAAGILLLAGLTGILYIVFRTPSTNLLTNENAKVEQPKSAAPVSPLMETQSAAPASPITDQSAPVASVQKVKPSESEQNKPSGEPAAKREKAEAADVQNDTVSLKEDLLAQEEVVVLDYADKKVKSLNNPINTEPVPENSVRAEQALQGKAAGVQVNSVSDYESDKLRKESALPELTKPVPPGGSLRSFKKWVNDRLDYPAYKEYPGKHKVTVELTVNADGTLGNIRLNRDVPDVIAADLKKVISQSSHWTAAQKDGNPLVTDVEFHFVITVE